MDVDVKAAAAEEAVAVVVETLDVETPDAANPAAGEAVDAVDAEEEADSRIRTSET